MQPSLSDHLIVFVQLEFIKGYSDYVNVYEQARETISRLRSTNSKFAAFLEEREVNNGVVTPLENYLIMPVQRVPRYELLLTALLRHTWKSHPDYASLVEATKRATLISERVNERKRLRENHDKMLQVYNSLTFGKKEKVDKSFLMNKTTRSFVQEGELTEQTIKGTPTRFLLFMFNDLLVWTKPKGRNTYSFQTVDELATAQVKVHETPSRGVVVHMKCEPDEDTRIPHYMRIFKADTDEDTHAWAHRIHTYIEIARTERQKQKDEKERQRMEREDRYSTTGISSPDRSPRPVSMMHPNTNSAALLNAASAHDRLRASKQAQDERRKPRGIRSTHLKLTELRFLDEFERQKNERVSEQVSSIKAWQTTNDRAELSRFEITSLSPVFNQDAPLSARGSQPKSSARASSTIESPSSVGSDEALAQAMFQIHGPETCKAFHEMINALSTLSLHCETPEIVFLGKQGSGKTSLLSSVVGYPLPLDDLRRPLFVHLIQNPSHTAESPLIWIRKDYTQRPRITKDVKISSPDQLSKELVKRASKEYSEAPIHLFYEASHVLNATLIDTPGLDAFQFHDDTPATLSPTGRTKLSSRTLSALTAPLPPMTVRSLVYEVARLPHRHLVFVEECKHKGLMASAAGLATVVDPSLSRSTFACTKFFHELRDMHSTAQLFTYLHYMPNNSFFVTLPSAKALAQVAHSRLESQRLILQAYARDLEIMDILQYDTRFAPRIGVHNFTRSIFSWVHKRHVQHIPHSLEQLHDIAENNAKQQLALEPRKQWTQTEKLRKVANAFTFDVVKALPQILFGSTQIEAKVHGQSMADERELLEDHGIWVDFYNQPIVGSDVDAFNARIPYHDAKLFGSAQIIRLFSAFNAIVQELQLRQIDREEIVAVVGQSYIMNTRDFYLQAALTLAHQKAESALLPLVNQLCKRAGDMIKRLGAIAVRIVDEGSTSSSSLLIQQGQYKPEMDIPLFAGHVRVQYEHFGEELEQRCLSACAGLLDQVLIVDPSKYADFDLPADGNSDRAAVEKVITALVARMFQDISKLFVRNITAQCYELLVARGVEDISRSLQSSIAGLSDAELSLLFDKDSFRIALEKEQAEIKALEKMSELAAEKFKKSLVLFSDSQAQRHPASKVSYRKLPFDAQAEADFAATEVALAAAAAKEARDAKDGTTPRSHASSTNTHANLGRKTATTTSATSDVKPASKEKKSHSREKSSDVKASSESKKSATREESKTPREEPKEVKETKEKTKEKPTVPAKSAVAVPEVVTPVSTDKSAKVDANDKPKELPKAQPERKLSAEPPKTNAAPASASAAPVAASPAKAASTTPESSASAAKKPADVPAKSTAAPLPRKESTEPKMASADPKTASGANSGSASSAPAPVATAATASAPKGDKPIAEKPKTTEAAKPTVPIAKATAPAAPIASATTSTAVTPRDATAIEEPLVRPSAKRTLSFTPAPSSAVTSAGTANAKEVIPANNAAQKIAAFSKAP